MAFSDNLTFNAIFVISAIRASIWFFFSSNSVDMVKNLLWFWAIFPINDIDFYMTLVKWPKVAVKKFFKEILKLKEILKGELDHFLWVPTPLNVYTQQLFQCMKMMSSQIAMLNYKSSKEFCRKLKKGKQEKIKHNQSFESMRLSLLLRLGFDK